MNKAAQLKELKQEADGLNRDYGHLTGSLGSSEYKLNVIPTGIMALDYELGIGGWPIGSPVEIFGPPDIGKSSVIGFSAIKSAQQQGMTAGIIALEPNFDEAWAIKNGVDPDLVVIARPDNGEDAFSILHRWVNRPVVPDFILFDSIGAVLRESETQADGKMAAGGQAGLITWGVKRVLAPCWKNNKTVMFLNQIRDVMNSRFPAVESPGGHALKHSCDIRVQLKPGKDKYVKHRGTKEDGYDELVGQKLIAVIKRNKRSEGSNRKASFDFYQKETEDHPVGIDVAADVIATGTKTGVIQKNGGWLSHPSFPGDKHHLNGPAKVRDFLDMHPQVVEEIRQEVLTKMLEREVKEETDGEEG